MRVNVVCQQIAELTEVESLDKLITAAKARKQVLARQSVYQLMPGDFVRFAPTIRPQYLAGLPCKIVQHNHKTVAVACPINGAYARFAGSRRVRLPLDLVGSKLTTDEVVKAKQLYGQW